MCEQSTGQSCMINGITVQFPGKPYPSQRAMMFKILQGLGRRQNCLLESPTGSGKSLALLCAALSWQSAEYEKARAEEENEAKAMAQCTCGIGDVQITDIGSNQVTSNQTANQMVPTNSLLTPVKQPISDDVIVLDGDHDFKVDQTKFRTPGAVQVVTPGVVQSPNSTAAWTMEVTHPETAACFQCTCGKQSKSSQRRVPKIYYGTRTHKQIAQVTKEMGKTAYRHARMTILSSREHTCIDPHVSTSTTKNEDCKFKLEHGGCRYSDRVRRYITPRNMDSHGVTQAWDLEEFVSFCKKPAIKACPYFGVRQLRESADIVFCPYNYLIDPLIRNSMEINLKNQIVILDEAHNIEDATREAASFSVNQKQLWDTVTDIQRLKDYSSKSEDYNQLEVMVTSFNHLIEQNQHKLPTGDFNNASKVWTGVDMVAQLSNLGVGPKDFSSYQGHMRNVMAEDSEEGGEGKLHSSSLKLIEAILMVLSYIYRDDMKYLQDYRIALVRTMAYEERATNARWLNKRARNYHEPTWTYVLNFWCLNPAVAFSDIGHDAHCIVLTSGTLSPMSSFESELGVPFGIQLQADHVTSASQVWVGAISEGPGHSSLLGTYQSSESFTYQDDVGAVILRVCLTIPYGVLCFLSSYAALDRLAKRWKSTGLWTELQQCKRVMTEPRGGNKVDFDEVIKFFYENIRSIEEANENGEPGAITGVLFFAVCRGKVSEGLDFTDNNARAVITVGIPFPNIKDTQVDLKKEYNNMHSQKRGLLRGAEWYEIQAFRALNQALGRCIRHRLDWGALILLDARFGKNPKKYSNGLSKWVRQKMQYFSAFNHAEYSLKQFTQSRLAASTDRLNNSLLCVASPNVSCTMTTPNKEAVTPMMKVGEQQSASPVLSTHPAPLRGYSQAGGFLPPTQDEVDGMKAERFLPCSTSTQLVDLTQDCMPMEVVTQQKTESIPIHNGLKLCKVVELEALQTPIIIKDENQNTTPNTLQKTVTSEQRACSPELFESDPLPMSNDSCTDQITAAVNEMKKEQAGGALKCATGEQKIPVAGRRPLFRYAPVRDCNGLVSIVNTEKVAEVKRKTSDEIQTAGDSTDQVEGTDGTLVIRRGKRRRTPSSTRTARKQRGVVFTDEDLNEAEHDLRDDSPTRQVTVSNLTCSTCHSRLADMSDMKEETWTPCFMKCLQSSANHIQSYPYLYVTQNVVHGTLCVTRQQAAAGVELDSHWSEDDGCCVQYLSCVNCTNTVIAAITKCTTPAHDGRLTVGQVWLLPQHTTISSNHNASASYR